MTHYTQEQRKQILNDYRASGLSLLQYAKTHGIAKSTLYHWRSQTADETTTMKHKKYSPEQRFQIVLETATFNETQMSEYCRNAGLYPKEIKAWREACMSATDNTPATLSPENKADKKRIKQLEKELHRKEKALAETAALLVLRKKFNAIYGLDEDH